MIQVKDMPRRSFMSQDMQAAMGSGKRTHERCIKVTGVARPGKTAKDRANGATERNFANKRARVEWYDSKSSTNNTFPKDSCNGKKNRYFKQ